MPDETEQNIIKELKEANIEPFNIIKEIPPELPIHHHSGTDGSLRVNQSSLENREEGGKFGNMVVKTNNFSTNATSFTDVTDLSITITETESYKRRYLLMCSGSIYPTDIDKEVYLTFDIDGTNVGNLLTHQVSGAGGYAVPFCIHYITDELNLLSTTFKVQAKATTPTSVFLVARTIFSATRLLS